MSGSVNGMVRSEDGQKFFTGGDDKVKNKDRVTSQENSCNHKMLQNLKEVAQDQAPSLPSRSDSLQFLSLPQIERFDWSCRIVRGLESLISHSGP